VKDSTTAITAALIGLDGFEVLAAADAGGELELLVQTTADLVGCPSCGAVARAKDRRPSWVRDLPVAGRPVVLCWVKRVWCCPHPLCEQRTWTERHEAIAPRATLTERARAWAFEQVGRHDAAVSRTASVLGVAWWTVMRQIIQRGTSQVEDPARLQEVTAVGVDETAYLRANATRSTTFATGIADLTPGRSARLLDVVKGRSGSVLASWLADRDQAWRVGIATASLDPFRGYASALPASSRTRCGCWIRSMWSASPWPPSMTCVAGSSTPRPGTGAARVTRSMASAGSCAAAPTISPRRPGPGWRPG
jgi:transposase